MTRNVLYSPPTLLTHHWLNTLTKVLNLIEELTDRSDAVPGHIPTLAIQNILNQRDVIILVDQLDAIGEPQRQIPVHLGPERLAAHIQPLILTIKIRLVIQRVEPTQIPTTITIADMWRHFLAGEAILGKAANGRCTRAALAAWTLKRCLGNAGRLKGRRVIRIIIRVIVVFVRRHDRLQVHTLHLWQGAVKVLLVEATREQICAWQLGVYGPECRDVVFEAVLALVGGAWQVDRGLEKSARVCQIAQRLLNWLRLVGHELVVDALVVVGLLGAHVEFEALEVEFLDDVVELLGHCFRGFFFLSFFLFFPFFFCCWANTKV